MNRCVCELSASAKMCKAGTARLAICRRTTVFRVQCSFATWKLFAAFRHDKHPVAQGSDECSGSVHLPRSTVIDCLQWPVEACRREAAPGMKRR